MPAHHTFHRHRGYHGHSLHSAGFTLPELLIVLCIIGILLAAGVPSFRTYLQTQQVITASSQFMFALNLARSEAIQRGARVDLGPRDGLHWENGWVVFVNKPRDSQPQFDTGDELIYSYDDRIPGLQVATTLSDKSYPYIAYNGNGRPRSNLNALTPQWGSWQFSLNSKERVVRITLAGRARLCNPADDASCRFSGTSSGSSTAMPDDH
ncbi:GspH/FimT family pseudopilin [Herbaspirillum rhizosphaerae]|uniref:Type II secretion system protein H n=1 Tax=Herbaspirillum rhizosphaerae TaxID=346179 RepID=A0ABW8ZDV7_9BURK